MVPPSETGTIERFLQTLLRSGLMKQEAIAAVFQSAGEDERKDAQKLAELFVRQGKLSHFQSRKLLEGTATGLVLGPYHIVMPIGRGGMGTVYLARDTQSPRLLALKVLPPAKARANDRVLARFLREMEMSRRVSHPNLTQTIDVGVENGVYFIAMEYIAGVSLYRLVSTGGVLPVGRAAKLFAQAAEGLAHAHSQGLIHRDLKPSNIMVTPRDQVKILDLGLALAEGDDLTNVDPEVIGGQGYVVGTMDYIAPEQTQNATAVTPRSDLYSLGCSLYFAMTGQPPFPGGDGKEKIRKHRELHPKPVQEINPLVPADFSDVIHQLLAKLPEERPASAAEFRKLLLRFADPIPQPYETSAKPPESRWADEMEILQAEPVEEVPSQSEWEWMPSVSLAETARDHPVAPPTIPAKWLLWAVPGALGLLMLLLLILGLRKR